MSWKGWAFLMLLGVALVVGSLAKADPQDSKYTPMCFETHCKPPNLNTVYALSGPTKLQESGQAPETSFTLGYMRHLRDDLSLGGAAIWTDKRFIGWQLGLGYHF